MHNETPARPIVDWCALGGVVWFAALPHLCSKELTFNKTIYSWIRKCILQKFSRENLMNKRGELREAEMGVSSWNGNDISA